VKDLKLGKEVRQSLSLIVMMALTVAATMGIGLVAMRIGA
jgi:hypothetical protein